MERREFRIEGEWSLDNLLGYLRTWSATESCVPENGEGFFIDASEKIAEAWGDPAEEKKYSNPLRRVTGRNR